LALDPQSVEAQTRLAGLLVGLRVINVTNDLAAAGLARADELIGRALEASPHYAQAHHVKGQVLRAQNRWEEAILEYETALALNPNLVVALKTIETRQNSSPSRAELEVRIHLTPAASQTKWPTHHRLAG
jgi:tetratricopeptide (TPR) repeat protein